MVAVIGENYNWTELGANKCESEREVALVKYCLDVGREVEMGPMMRLKNDECLRTTLS